MIAADFHDHTLGNTGTPQVPSAGSAQIMKQQSLVTRSCLTFRAAPAIKCPFGR
jgi:hypothetical protein